MIHRRAKLVNTRDVGTFEAMTVDNNKKRKMSKICQRVPNINSYFLLLLIAGQLLQVAGKLSAMANKRNFCFCFSSMFM